MLPMLRTNLPFSPLGATGMNRLDTLFDRFFGDDFERPFGRNWTWSSVPVSMWQDENNIFVEAELPGVEEKDVDVTINNGILTIKAERHDQEGRGYLYNGRTFGRFERAVVLPESVDSDHVEASLAHGVLRVVLPKHPDARPKKIALKTA
jgi:HSP20 family protein